MSKILFDLSGTIDSAIVAALSILKSAADSCNCPFFMVGASARDFILKHCYGIEPRRLLPGLALMKIVSWSESYPARTKDAEDLLLIMNKYEDAGNLERLYEEEPDLLQEEKFDTRLAGIRLLGRDMARIADSGTLRIVQGILEEETRNQSRYKLITDMVKNSKIFEDNFDDVFDQLMKLKTGFGEY